MLGVICIFFAAWSEAGEMAMELRQVGIKTGEISVESLVLCIWYSISYDRFHMLGVSFC